MKNSPQLVMVQVAKYFNLKFMEEREISHSKKAYHAHTKNKFSKKRTTHAYLGAQCAQYLEKYNIQKPTNMTQEDM